jgi:hypothetical protein
MKLVVVAMLAAFAVSSCSGTAGPPTRQMFPDCSQVGADEQRQGHCVWRPDVPDRM